MLIDFPADPVARLVEAAAVSTVTLAELALGLHTADPLVSAGREPRPQWITATFEPIPFGADAARTCGALCATVRQAGRDPKPRRFASWSSGARTSWRVAARPHLAGLT